jgi:excisionase family DNA binding protein
MSLQPTSGSASPPLTPTAAAAYLGLDVKTITRWARQGYLPGHPLGEGKRKFWRFLEGELAEWLTAKTNRSEAV